MAVVRVMSREPACLETSDASSGRLSMRPNAIVCATQVRRQFVHRKALRGNTHVDNALNLAKHRRHWLSNERNSFEKASLADEDIQEDLVDADELGLSQPERDDL